METERRRIVVRPYRAGDRDEVLALAPRLTEGVAAWREAGAVAEAVVGWVTGSLERAARGDAGVFVAECDGRVAGFVTVTVRAHFTGQLDGYIGELAVAPDATGRGAGRALVAAAEGWARDRGLENVVLETGAANRQALGFYRALGYVAEEVRLRRPVGAPGPAVREPLG
ncbi:GNAT family N-acetyltransferase [Streptosporangium sp. NPDC051022]|uniref:GNAT family N-acetyltransferase n=1 Tax=Streptosporangium sp. NPDC051022 TaxID=3155752 RepID=UPI003425C95F